jgi:hypothetical protein
LCQPLFRIVSVVALITLKLSKLVQLHLWQQQLLFHWHNFLCHKQNLLD